MIDFILDVILLPKVVFGTLMGLLAAAGIYYFFPDSNIKTPLVTGAVVVGFLVGLIFSADENKN